MNKSKDLAKSTIVLGIGQFLPKVFAVATLPLITKALSVSEYGIYDLILSFSTLAIPLVTLLIQQAVFRFLIEDDSDVAKRQYISTAVTLTCLLSVCSLILAFMTSIIVEFDSSILISATILYISEAFLDMFGQISRGLKRNTWYSASAIICSLFSTILIIITSTTNSLTIFSALAIGIFSYITASIFLLFKLKIHRQFSLRAFSTAHLKRMLKYSLPVIPSSISLWITNLSDRLLVTWFLGEALNGIYAAACKIPNIFGTFYNVFNLAWTEIAARSIKEKNISIYYSKLFRALFTFLTGVLLLIIPLSPIIFNLLINVKFIDGYNQLFILYLGIFFSCIVSFYGGLYVALKKTGQVGLSSLAGAILNVIINILLIKHIGLYAASISTFLSFFVIAIYRYVQLKRYISLTYNSLEIVSGIALLVLAGITFYLNFPPLNIATIIIAIFYNIHSNAILKIIWQKLQKVKQSKLIKH